MRTQAIPRPEHPRPDFYRPQWLNLNGEWQFSFDDEDAGLKNGWFLPGKRLERRITVPFCYQCEESGVNITDKHDILWYRRAFTVPEEMAGKRILARFGAVDYACAVFVNGHRAGEHSGGYTPFALDITPYLTDGENDLCLRVEDRADCTQPRGKQNWKDKRFGCWYTPVSGIWQTVYLEAVGDYYLTDAQITPDIDEGTASIRLTLDRAPHKPVLATLRMFMDGVLFREQTLTLAERSQRAVFDMVSGGEIVGFSMWSPNHPALYDVEIELDCGDRVSTYFGMRKIQVKDGYVLINNRPLYQRLVLDQGYWPQSLLTPPSDEAIREDIEWTKRFGYNGARKHQKLEDPRYYYWADKLGLLVWGEVPSTYEFTPESVRNLSETLTDFIRRDFNHPCIIAWVPLNESWGVDRIYTDRRMQMASETLYCLAKSLDGTRLVSANDGWDQTRTDIYALHDYASEGAILAAHFADRQRLDVFSNDHRMSRAQGYPPRGDEALMLTEYGGIAMEEPGGEADAWGYHDKVSDEEAFFARYQAVTDAAIGIPGCQGYCYTQLTDVQQEVNGLLTPDRKPKIDPKRFSALTRNPFGRYV